MSFSIYTSLYNLSAGFIDYKAALDNFTVFGEEVVVATTTDSKDNTIELLQEYQKTNPKVKLVITDFKLDSAYFDGELKNAALKQCLQPFCILLDGDERVTIEDKPQWEKFANLMPSNCDALLIPVIDLFNSDREYKSLGQKWYISRNSPNLTRGVVNFAKNNDGTININASDSTELININGDLCKSISIFYPDYPTLQAIKEKNYPKVWHLGWLDKENRLKANAFWKPVWENRAGHKVDNIIESKDKLDKIEFWPHGLKLWHE